MVVGAVLSRGRRVLTLPRSWRSVQVPGSTAGIDQGVGVAGPQATCLHASAEQCRHYGNPSVARRTLDPIFELRTYVLKPENAGDYLRSTAEYANVRKRLIPGWLGFWTTETGGRINEVKHFYAYKGGLVQREEQRKALSKDPEWTGQYLPAIRPTVSEQHSTLFVEAEDCMMAMGLPSATGAITTARPEGGAVYEMRLYNLHAGYGTVPALRKLFVDGLPARISADVCGQCVFMGSSDAGRLNQFLELWKHESMAAMMEARKAARKVKKWSDTIAGVAPLTQSFQLEILRPTSFSPWQ